MHEPHEFRAAVEIYQLVVSLHRDGLLDALATGVGRPEGDPTSHMGMVFGEIIARHRREEWARREGDPLEITSTADVQAGHRRFVDRATSWVEPLGD